MRNKIRAALVALVVAVTGLGGAVAVSSPVTASGNAANPFTSAGISVGTPPRNAPGVALEGIRAPKALPAKAKAGVQTKSLSTLSPGLSYYYNVGSQGFPIAGQSTYPTGVVANFSAMIAGNPKLDVANDYHTLMEVSAEKTVGGLRQVVEVGVTVDQGVNGDIQPRVFVFTWLNGVAQCYNGCGYVALSGVTPNAGSIVTTSKSFGAIHFTAAQANPAGWWFCTGAPNACTTWMGYVPDTKFTGASPSVSFPNLDYGQAFAEIAAGDSDPAEVCTDMGSYTLATPTAGAYFGSATFTGIAAADTNLYIREAPTGIDPYWNAEALGTVGNQRSFRFGGPGQTNDPPCPTH